MPDSTGFGDYTESGQVIPVKYKGQEGGYTVSIRRRPQGPSPGRVGAGRCGQAACWAVWLSRAAFQVQGSRASIWCAG
jgi:hypothetical protein